MPSASVSDKAETEASVFATAGPAHSQAGFSLMEAVVATVIAVVAIVGLAHTFGLGRGFIERFAIGRDALGVAQGRMEALTVMTPSSDSLAIGRSFSFPFAYRGFNVGTEEWRIDPYNDPAGSSSTDMKMVTVKVRWGQGAERDSILLTRVFPLR